MYIITVLGKKYTLTSARQLTGDQINDVAKLIVASGGDLKRLQNSELNYIFRTMGSCGWWIKNISVLDKTVSFYISIAGNSWSIVLKNSSGAVEASTSGSGYGPQSLTATSYGAHTLELTCNWATSNPCEVCSVNVPAPTCVPAWICEQPLNGYEKDGCGNRRLNPACNPTTCIPSWTCEQPLNGYESDGCGNRRVNTICNPTGGCIPSWKCEQPLNGYESDGCGNRRTNSSCNPSPPGPGAGTLLGIGLVSAGVLGVVVYASRKRR